MAENYQTMLNVCMWATPIFAILFALSGFGWNYYGLKIKEQDKKEAVQKKIDTMPKDKDTFHIQGDYVKGDKVTKSKKQIIAPNALIVTEGQTGGQNSVTQYFGAKDPKHMVKVPTFEPVGSYGNNVLHENQAVFTVGTMYSFDVKIPEHDSLKILLTRLEGVQGDEWRYRLGTQKNWKPSTFKNGYQEFTLSGGDDKAELEIHFAGKGSARLEILFNDKLLSHKVISWQ